MKKTLWLSAYIMTFFAMIAVLGGMVLYALACFVPVPNPLAWGLIGIIPGGVFILASMTRLIDFTIDRSFNA